MIHKILIGFGLTVGILPFLGFPRGMEDILTSAGGFIVAGIVAWHVRHGQEDRRPPTQL